MLALTRKYEQRTQSNKLVTSSSEGCVISQRTCLLSMTFHIVSVSLSLILSSPFSSHLFLQASRLYTLLSFRSMMSLHRLLFLSSVLSSSLSSVSSLLLASPSYSVLPLSLIFLSPSLPFSFLGVDAHSMIEIISCRLGFIKNYIGSPEVSI